MIGRNYLINIIKFIVWGSAKIYKAFYLTKCFEGNFIPVGNYFYKKDSYPLFYIFDAQTIYMKKFYTLLVVAFIGFIGNAQIVNIPDANFKNILCHTNCVASVYPVQSANDLTDADLNDDGEIQVSEAELVQVLDLTSTLVTDITGIRDFVNIKQIATEGCTGITAMDLHGLNQLVLLNCYNNRLTSLNVSECTSITDLDCSANRFTNLDVSNLTNLVTLHCEYNLINNLNFTNCYALEYMYIFNNRLTSIDISGYPNIHAFSPRNNLLVSMNIKNGAGIANFNWAGNPTLRYICCDESMYTIASILASPYMNSNIVVNSYCSFVPGGNNNIITGTLRYDSNSNGCDSSDPIFQNSGVKINDGTNIGYGFTNSNGNYTFYVNQPNLTLTPILENPTYFTVSPSSTTVNFPAQTSPVNQDFCIRPNITNPIHNDLEITLIPVEAARPGFVTEYKIIYKNKGTQPQSGTINLSYDDNLIDLGYNNPGYSSQSANSVTWNFSNLQPFETRRIDVEFLINTPTQTPPVNSGDVLHYTATITGATDETPIDNTSVLNHPVVNSFDPNDKTCVEGTTISTSMVGKYLHYVIRFENTGTANAQNIVVKDVIDTTKYDLNSLIPLSGSHPFTTKIYNTNWVEFIFQNINLPFDDANNDGYIAFKIKTKTPLPVGSTISNKAGIFFDYNPVIITNTYTTTVATLGNQDFDFGSVFTLSPVPAKNSLIITTKQDVVMSSASIYNMLGQLIQVITNPSETIDVSGLKTGSYFIKIISDKGTASSKFVKE